MNTELPESWAENIGIIPTIEGREPLNATERVVYVNLDNHLKGVDISKLTDAQKFSAARVIRQQGFHNGTKKAFGEGFGSLCLIIQFPHITIGIETDGYAHS